MSLSASAAGALHPLAVTYASNRATKAAARAVAEPLERDIDARRLTNVSTVKRGLSRLRASPASATMADMASTAPPAFLSLLRDRGLSVSAASKLIGNKDSLGQMFGRKARSMRTEKLALLAARLDVTMDDLARIMGLSGVGPPLEGGGRGLSLPVRHIVQAGAWFAEDLEAQAFSRRLPIGPDPRFAAAQWLEEVRGDSVDEIIPDGGIAQVADWADLGLEPRDGMLVIARAVRDGGMLAERTIKRVRRKGRTIELWPESKNPRWSKPVLAADLARPAGGEDGEEISLAGLVISAHAYFTA